MKEISLTINQQDKLKTEFDKVVVADQKGKPGMLLAQIGLSGRMYVGFIDHKNAIKIQKITGKHIGESGVI